MNLKKNRIAAFRFANRVPLHRDAGFLIDQSFSPRGHLRDSYFYCTLLLIIIYGENVLLQIYTIPKFETVIK